MSAARLPSARSANVSIIFGLATLPMMLMLGVAVDYGRVATARTRLQSAADRAALAAGARSTLTQSQRAQIATNAALANLGGYATHLSVTVTETEPTVGAYQVKIDAAVPTTVMKLARYDTIAVSVKSEAKNIGASADQPLEIALALDNTGSMKDDMASLKSAAKTLVQSVMGGGGGAVKVSVVPYVAAVNPGISTSYIDTKADNPWTGDWFRWSWVAYNAGCSQNWGSGGSGGAGEGGSGDANDLIELLNPFRRIVQELFGVSSAHAADVTANTVPPFTINNWTSTASPYRTYKKPAGFNTVPKGSGTSTGGCEWLTNPGTVSNYELFDRVKKANGSGTVAWKGCVEARPTSAELTWMNTNWGSSYTVKDYSATDEAPVSTVGASLFTPYFAPDEPDISATTWTYVAPGAYTAGSGGFRNNYMADGTIPSSGTKPSATNWGWTMNYGTWNGTNLFTYNNTTTPAIINETGPNSYGPNAGCPDQVQRLTNNQGQVISKIESLSYWNFGGTIVSEGLMWAWRTLSPKAPYQDGQAYNTAGLKKVIVLMTDGVNELNDNTNNATDRNTGNISDYNAYGYLGATRLYNANGVTTFAQATTFLNNRLLAACTNAKAAGVKIYTVLFSANLTTAQTTASQNLLQQCASQASYAFNATDGAGLTTAFGAIASSAAATPLRLTQ